MQPLLQLAVLNVVMTLCLFKWASANTTTVVPDATTPLVLDPSSWSQGGIHLNISDDDEEERFAEINSARIVGGVDAKSGAWPFMVSLWWKNKQHVCGGSILTDDTILTAGHCVLGPKAQGLKATDLEARIGDILKDNSNAKLHFPVRTWGVHASFNMENLPAGYDIGVMKLERWIDFDALGKDKVAPVCLPENEADTPVASKCMVMGWGFTNPNVKKASPTLKQVRVPMVDNHACAKSYGYFSTESLVCAGYKKGGMDACQGDSGGPLVCPPKSNAEDHPWIQYGIVSYGASCAKTYGLYTKVTPFIPWILERAEERGGKLANDTKLHPREVSLNRTALLDDIVWL